MTNDIETEADRETQYDPYDLDELNDDFEDNVSETQKPTKISGERLLTFVGLALAAAAALFPWYVFLNEESFGIAPMADYSNSRDLSKVAGRANVIVSPLAIPAAKPGDAPESVFDPITTATIPDSKSQQEQMANDQLSAPVSQAFPGSPHFQLLHVVNGRALIEDKTGVYLVRQGSVLPDNSRLAKFEKRAGKWVIITSNGDVVQP